MQKNVGQIDRVIRIVAGLAIIGVGVYMQSWWGAVGVVLLGTGLMGWCPPYALLGINSCGGKSCGKVGEDSHA